MLFVPNEVQKYKTYFVQFKRHVGLEHFYDQMIRTIAPSRVIHKQASSLYLSSTNFFNVGLGRYHLLRLGPQDQSTSPLL